MTTQTITVEHVRVESAKSFPDVRAALERTLPHLELAQLSPSAHSMTMMQTLVRPRSRGHLRRRATVHRGAMRPRSACGYKIGADTRPTSPA
jgi:hypothetical protein